MDKNFFTYHINNPWDYYDESEDESADAYISGLIDSYENELGSRQLACFKALYSLFKPKDDDTDEFLDSFVEYFSKTEGVQIANIEVQQDMLEAVKILKTLCHNAKIDINPNCNYSGNVFYPYVRNDSGEINVICDAFAANSYETLSSFLKLIRLCDCNIEFSPKVGNKIQITLRFAYANIFYEV